MTGTFVAARVPPYVTQKPWLLMVAPLPNACTAAVAPAGRIGASAAVMPAAE
jgi:hypothetical protein